MGPSSTMSHHVAPTVALFAALTGLVGVAVPAFAQSSSVSSPSVPEASRAPAPLQPEREPAGMGPESSLLLELREAEREQDPAPANVADGASAAGTPLPEGLDADFAARIRMPGIAIRITPRIARSLALFRSEPRARRALAAWMRRAGRYRTRIEAILAQEGVPTDLVWVVAAESGFEPGCVSSAGAVGLWQLMADAARTYGLRVDTWVDERRDPDRSTRAAARYLRDLHARFGAWDLALAAYNMGYNGLLRAIRKYNTNSFEMLADLEAGLPWETAHYAPRILSTAIVAYNAVLFGFTGLAYDAPVVWEEVRLERSLPLDALARAAGIEPEALRALNPALVRTRTPPADAEHPFVLHVPLGTRARVEVAAASLRPSPTRVYRARHGETLEEIAARYRISAPELLALSGLPVGRRVAPGTELLVPDRDPIPVLPSERPLVAMHDVPAPPAGARRVFYRVGVGDELPVLARAIGVRSEDLLAWNALDPTARLQPGMWLQAYVTRDPPAARVWEVSEVDLVRRGSEEFLDRAVERDGRVRVRVTVREGDTMASIAQRYGLSVGSLARINHRSRSSPLRPGESLVVYTDPERIDAGEPTVPSPSAAAQGLPTAPEPSSERMPAVDGSASAAPQGSPPAERSSSVEPAR